MFLKFCYRYIEILNIYILKYIIKYLLLLLFIFIDFLDFF